MIYLNNKKILRLKYEDKNIARAYYNNKLVFRGIKTFSKLDIQYFAGLTSVGHQCSFTADGIYFAIANHSSNGNNLAVFKRNENDTFTKINSSNFNDVYNTYLYGCSFTADGSYLSIAGDFLAPRVYKREGDTFTMLKIDENNKIKTYKTIFSADGSYLFYFLPSSSNRPFYAYKREGDTFTKLDDTIDNIEGSSNWFSVDAHANYLAVVRTVSPYLYIYKRNNDTFTKLDGVISDSFNPYYIQECSFTADGKYLAIVQHYSSPYLLIYKRDGDTFTKLSFENNDPFYSNYMKGCSFSADGNYLAVTMPYQGDSNHQEVLIFVREGDTFIQYDKIISSIRKQLSSTCSFSADGTYLGILDNSDNKFSIYKGTI
jgi:hypothetical protein